MTTRTRIRAGSCAALVLLLTAAFGLVWPSQAQALPGGVTCYGDYCSGQMPEATGCDKDAVTVASVAEEKGSGQLDLRWSPTCKTNWARWQQYPVGWCLVCAPVGIIAEQDTGYRQAVEFGGMGGDGPVVEEGGTYWTPMIYSPVHGVRAIAQMTCGDATLVSTAFDCLTSQVKTAYK